MDITLLGTLKESRPLILVTDASKKGGGGTLFQVQALSPAEIRNIQVKVQHELKGRVFPDRTQETWSEGDLEFTPTPGRQWPLRARKPQFQGEFELPHGEFTNSKLEPVHFLGHLAHQPQTAHRDGLFTPGTFHGATRPFLGAMPNSGYRANPGHLGG